MRHGSRILSTLAFATLIAFTSCSSDESEAPTLNQNIGATSLDEAMVPADFAFEMQGRVALTATSTDFSDGLESVNLYREFPGAEDRPLATIYRDQFAGLQNNIILRTADQGVYATYVFTDGTRFTEYLPLENNALELPLANVRLRANANAGSQVPAAEVVSSPSIFTCSGSMDNANAELPLTIRTVNRPRYYFMNEADIPGWSTTASDDIMEIWQDGFNGVSAPEGGQFFEINAHRWAALYKEVCLTPCTTVRWSIKHRGRLGVDAAAVKIGGSLATAVTMDTMTTGQVWTEYSGTYTVPQGETTTYFIFETVASHQNRQSYGNFIDDFQLEWVASDSDCDGISDASDRFPNNANLSGIIYSDTNSFAAEDNWPYEGDFDFNDIVVPHSHKALINPNGQVASLTFYYQVIARGASKKNGFGFSLPGDPANIASITGQTLTEGYVNNDANGAEIGAGSFISIVGHDLVDNALPAFNTIPGTTPGASAIDSITVDFSTPLSAAALLDLKPFLIVDRSRGQELREMDIAPTGLMNTRIFGSGLDNSDPSQGLYYRSKDNLPWVLNIPGVFRYPYEQVRITDGYHHFVTWFQTGGAEHADWYDPTDPANIDGTKLFPQR